MRSKNQAAVPFDPVKVETIPLLNSTMESEMLKQQQNMIYQRQPMMTLQNGGIPQYIPNSIPIQSTIIPRMLKNPMEEENLSNWEENFQDLSGWCLGTTVQNRCNFPIGESINQAYKLIDTRHKINDIMYATGSNTNDRMQYAEKKSIVQINNNINNTAHRPGPVTGERQVNQQEQQHQQNSLITRKYDKNNLIIQDNRNNIPETQQNLWANLPSNNCKNTTVASINENWPRYNNLPLNTQLTTTTTTNPKNSYVDVNNTNLEIKTQIKDEILNTFEADGSDGFDLLSYLCDDEIPSPGDSLSTNSSLVTDHQSYKNSANIIVSPLTCEPVNPLSVTNSPQNLVNDTLNDSLKLPQISSSLTGFSTVPLTTTSTNLTNATVTKVSSRKQRKAVKIEEKLEISSIERRSSRTTAGRTSREWGSASTSSTSTTSSRGRKRDIESDSDDDTGDEYVYKEARQKNNEASRRSRMNKKAKEMEMSNKASKLEKDNRVLRMKVEELEKLVTSMRNALLRSALNRETKINMF